MKKEIPWNRLAAEGIVIVASILLAFSIDAWWEERSEAQIEQELLTNLLDGVAATEAGILVLYERMDIDHRNLDYFFNATEIELGSIPRESLRGIYNALRRPLTFDASAMMQTVQVDSIKNSQVREKINSWIDTATELSTTNRRSESLSESASVAMGRHPVIQQFLINGIESLEPNLDLLALRNDNDLMAIVSSKKGAQNIAGGLFLPALQGINGELQQLLTTLIE